MLNRALAVKTAIDNSISTMDNAGSIVENAGSIMKNARASIDNARAMIDFIRMFTEGADESNTVVVEKRVRKGRSQALSSKSNESPKTWAELEKLKSEAKKLTEDSVKSPKKPKKISKTKQ